MSKHEKVTVWLFMIAVLLIIISCCPGGYEEATSILQGVATGLVSGIVLLLVTGIKSKEYKQLTEIYNIIYESVLVFSKISLSYSDLLKKTYGGNLIDKDNFEFYVNLTKESCNKYKITLRTIQNLEYNGIQNNVIKNNIREFINYTDKQIKEINKIGERASNYKALDNKSLIKIKKELNSINNKTSMISFQCLRLKDKINKQKEHIDNSLV